MHIEDTITAALIMFIGKCFVLSYFLFLFPGKKIPLAFSSGIIVGASVAKTTGSLFVFLRA